MPNIHIPKPFRTGSSRNPNNPIIKKAKRQTLFSDVNRKTPKEWVKTSAGTVLLERGQAVLPDDSRGDEMAAELKSKALDPRGTAVVRHREGVNMDRTHRYFFGQMPEMPWKRANNE